MRNCGYVMLTISIINLIIVVAMGFRYLPELELDNWLEIIKTRVSDFDFIILIDFCLVPVFWRARNFGGDDRYTTLGSY